MSVVNLHGLSPTPLFYKVILNILTLYFIICILLNPGIAHHILSVILLSSMLTKKKFNQSISTEYYLSLRLYNVVPVNHYNFPNISSQVYFLYGHPMLVALSLFFSPQVLLFPTSRFFHFFTYIPIQTFSTFLSHLCLTHTLYTHLSNFF